MDCTAKKCNLLWPVCLAVGVNEENKSIVLGQAILLSEDETSFTFFLNQLSVHGNVKFSPGVVFTDECSAEIAAVKRVLPDAVDLRCDWHFLKDIKKKVASLRLGDKARDEVIERFKQAWYSKTEERFNSSMTSFLAHTKTLPETAAASLAKYFDGQMKSKSRWAHCYRSNVLTLMASSTQRIESVNAQVGKACSGSTTFARLCVSLENIVVDAEDATSNSTFSRANSILLDTCITELNNRDGVT